MSKAAELRLEREYLMRVQQILYNVISRSKSHAEFQAESVRMILEEAWSELRMRSTALSQYDINQLDAEIDRFLTRKSFSESNAQRYERMLLRPFFARIDFQEEGDAEPVKIVIGLYSLKDDAGQLLVHDWRAPVCSLYYGQTPGPVSYMSPSGEISGEMTLKRQYGMEQGRLKYYVDTAYNIDDGMLLDILSGATSRHMRQIVATIQTEQSAAIRHEGASIVSVVGGAGSGKTSVAMHRAAYLMYRQRDILTSESIAVMSPSASFGEYISNVLPELGEDNIKTITLHSTLSELIGIAVEPPADQNEALLDPKNAQRRAGVRIKSDAPFIALLDEYADRYFNRGPMFEDLIMRKHLLAGKRELERLYREQFKMLSPAQRLTRIQTMMDARLAEWEKSLLPQYKEQLGDSYRGKELNFISQMAVSQQLHPIRVQIKNMLSPHPLMVYADALKGFDRAQSKIAAENAQANLVYWEDAPGITYLLIKLGFIKPDLSIRHLIVDEAQDYTDVALKFMKLYFSRAHMTLLGDPHQRTLPGLNECEPERWGDSLNDQRSPVIKLSRAYRSTMEITEFCNELLAARDMPLSFGRHGEAPERVPYSLDALNARVSQWQGQGYGRIAIITRGRKDTERLHPSFSGASVILDHSDELDFSKEITLSSYHFLKGLEFDAVAVVWPCVEAPADDERRRMYTACSRALHRLCLFNMSFE